MALINITSLQKRAMQILASQKAPAGIELLSYKRNRTIAIVLQSADRCLVLEKGYKEQEIEASMAELPRLLKTMIKREFPRSRKVRVFKFDHPDELERTHQKI